MAEVILSNIEAKQQEAAMNEEAENEKRKAFAKFFQNNYVFSKNGKIKSTTSNRYHSIDEVYNSYTTITRMMGLECLTREEVERAINILAPDQEEEEFFDLEEHLIKLIEEDGRFIHNRTWTQLWSRKPGGRGKLNADFNDLKRMLLAKKARDPELIKRKIPTGDIENTILDFMRRQKEEAFMILADEIKYDKTKEGFVREYLKKIYDHFQVQEDFEIFYTIMCHWAWQIKRKINSEEVIWHIWPNLYGPTGTGKSYFINKMCAVFEEFFVGPAKISDLLNETKEIKKITDSFIVYFDELALNKKDVAVFQENLSQDDINTLKSVLTASTLVTRVYGTQDQMKRDVTFSAISSANGHIYDVIFDAETMRRYFEFNCKRSTLATGEENRSLNEFLDKSIDFWKGINENRERGYWDPNDATGKKIWEIQKNYYPTISTMMAMTEFFDLEYDPKVKPIDAYKIYQDWCKSANYKAKTLGSWIKEVSRRWPNLIGSDGHPHICFTNERKFKKEEVDLTDDKVNAIF